MDRIWCFVYWSNNIICTKTINAKGTVGNIPFWYSMFDSFREDFNGATYVPSPYNGWDWWECELNLKGIIKVAGNSNGSILVRKSRQKSYIYTLIAWNCLTLFFTFISGCKFYNSCNRERERRLLFSHEIVLLLFSLWL